MSDNLAKDFLLDESIEVTLYHSSSDWGGIVVEGKVDTGADKSSVDARLGDFLDWEITGSVVVRNAVGKETRDRGRGYVSINGVLFLMPVTFSDRSDLRYPVLIGRDVINDLLILAEEE